MSSASSPPLLDALSSLKPNAIYTMAGPKQISAAASYFAQGAVRAFRLHQSGTLLEAILGGDSSPRVQFLCENGSLRAICGCRSGPDTCHHILATAMTIARVLHGSKFHREDLPEGSIKKLRAGLKAPSPETVSPKVIFVDDGQAGRFAIDYDSGLRTASWRTIGAPPGMKWLEWQRREPEKVAEAFCQWVSAKPEALEIEVRLPDGDLVLPRAEGWQMRAFTQFRVERDFVIIRRTVQAEGEIFDSFIDLGYGLILLPERALFASIQPPDAWADFAHLRSRNSLEPSITLGVSELNSLCRIRPGSNQMLLNAAGSPVGPVPTTCEGLLGAAIDGNGVRLCLRAASADKEELLVQGKLTRCFQKLFADGPFSLLVKSPARRRRLAERLAMLAARPSKEEIEKSFGETPHDPAFESPSMHGEDAMRCLRFLMEHLHAMDEPHLVAAPSAGENPWLLCTGVGTALGCALAAFISVFPDEDLLRSRELVFRMADRRFFSSLPALLEACARFGVAFRMDDGVVRTEKLELTVRAVRDGMIDWFELHPEARAGTLSIPRERWAEILRTGCFRPDDRSFVALDEASLAALGRLTALLEPLGNDPIPRLARLRLFDWLALRDEGMQCELPPEDEVVLSSLRKLEQIPRQPLPHGLRADLREYQRHGYDWLAFLYLHRFGGCLADDMGLGKTVQSIALLAGLQEGILASQSRGAPEPHLIVMPPTLLFNWRSEIERFAPQLRIQEYAGPERSRDFSKADVVFTTYELARRDIEILSKTPFDVVIFDEAQAIKNAAAARTRALGRLNARFRLCLTGTPLENHIGEFHSIMEAAVPGLFSDRRQFLKEYGSESNLTARARPFLLRRTKEKILTELPPLTETDRYFALSEHQRECYTRAVGEVRREVLAAFDERPAQQAGIIALSALLRLRQICIAPAMLSKELDTGSPKLDYLVEQLVELAEEGHSAIVFSQFMKALNLAGAALESAGLSFLRMDGSTPVSRRKEMVESFQSGKSPGIFLISLKTGGSGLNLTRASYIYHLDPWWNPAVEEQASARAHRIGQKNRVFVQRLLMSHTVEEKMMLLKSRKKALFTTVVENRETTSASGGAALTADDFRFLIEP